MSCMSHGVSTLREESASLSQNKGFSEVEGRGNRIELHVHSGDIGSSLAERQD